MYAQNKLTLAKQRETCNKPNDNRSIFKDMSGRSNNSNTSSDRDQKRSERFSDRSSSTDAFKCSNTKKHPSTYGSDQHHVKKEELKSVVICTDNYGRSTYRLNRPVDASREAYHKLAILRTKIKKFCSLKIACYPLCTDICEIDHSSECCSNGHAHEFDRCIELTQGDGSKCNTGCNQNEYIHNDSTILGFGGFGGFGNGDSQSISQIDSQSNSQSDNQSDNQSDSDDEPTTTQLSTTTTTTVTPTTTNTTLQQPPMNTTTTMCPTSTTHSPDCNCVVCANNTQSDNNTVDVVIEAKVVGTTTQIPVSIVPNLDLTTQNLSIPVINSNNSFNVGGGGSTDASSNLSIAAPTSHLSNKPIIPMINTTVDHTRDLVIHW